VYPVGIHLYIHLLFFIFFLLNYAFNHILHEDKKEKNSSEKAPLVSMGSSGVTRKVELLVVAILDQRSRPCKTGYICYGKAWREINGSSGRCSMARRGQCNKKVR